MRRTARPPGFLHLRAREARFRPTDAEKSAYERTWRIELKAEELFRRDYPTDSFAGQLPQFRSSCPDPVGDHYRNLAA